VELQGLPLALQEVQREEVRRLWFDGWRLCWRGVGVSYSAKPG
jgi:hypothetical protein